MRGNEWSRVRDEENETETFCQEPYHLSLMLGRKRGGRPGSLSDVFCFHAKCVRVHGCVCVARGVQKMPALGWILAEPAASGKHQLQVRVSVPLGGGQGGPDAVPAPPPPPCSMSVHPHSAASHRALHRERSQALPGRKASRAQRQLLFL